jgi:NAD(P)H-dependent FMN reductase
VFAASLRSGSLNHRLALLAARAITDRGGAVDLATLSEFDTPSYDEDVQASVGFPEGAERFRARLLANDAFVIASPEYNGSLPGVLKNTIDWVSRFQPQPFNGRHGLVMSASPSMVGGNRGLWALRVPLERLGAPVYPDMFSLAQAHQAFDHAGEIANPALSRLFGETVGGFMDLVEAAKQYPLVKARWVEFLGEPLGAATDRVEDTSTATADRT